MSRRRVVVGGEPPKPPTPQPPAPITVEERRSVELPPELKADWSSPRIAELVRQIRNDPAADPPREVLADVLEQAGEPARAELIQLQLRRASLPSWDVQLIEIELRERVLLAAHEKRWRAELPDLPGVAWGPFARGFVGTVAFESFDAFVEHGDACRAAAPIHGIAIPWPRSRKRAELDAIASLRELTLFGTAMARQDLEWLAGSPLLSSIRSLTFLDSELEHISPLFKSPHIGGLQTLALPLSRLDDDSVYRLVNATLPDLTTLELSKADPVEEYGGSGRRTRTVRRQQGTNYAAVALAGWPGLAQIRRLDLGRSKLGSAGLSALLKSPHSKGLKAVSLRDIRDRYGDDPLAAFGACFARAIDELDVRDNDLDAHGATCMADSRALQELKVLRIDGVMSEHFARLAQAPWFDSLRVLSCGQSALLPIVKRAPQQLHTLHVAADRKSSDLIKQLSAAPLSALRQLDLSEARLTDDDLRLLGTVTTLPGVVALQLSRGGAKPFTRAGIESFLKSPLGARLASLDTGFAELDRLPTPPRQTIGHGPYQGPRRYL